MLKQYRILCKYANVYNKGGIQKRDLVNHINSFLTLKLNKSVYSCIENIGNDVERMY